MRRRQPANVVDVERIVADSDVELEYRETLDKARGLIETLVEKSRV